MNKYPKSPSIEVQTHQPGIQSQMHPQLEVIKPNYQGSNKLKDKIALITCGDKMKMPKKPGKWWKKKAAAALALKYDLQHHDGISKLVERTLQKFQAINILINNASIHYPQKYITDINIE